MSKEDEFLTCCERLQVCLHTFREASVNLEGYLKYTNVTDNIQDMQTSMEKILHELEEKR